MHAERLPSSTSLIEILDRVLDKGIVIDVWVRVSLVGIEILTVEARVVIASIETFLKYAEEIRRIGHVAKPALKHSDHDRRDHERGDYDRSDHDHRDYERLVAENGRLRAQLGHAGA